MRYWKIALACLTLLILAVPSGAGKTVKRGPEVNVPTDVFALFDADGDGSGYVTCTAQNAPVPWCKVAGERIYPDFADDLMAMVHNSGPTGFVFPTGGTVLLDDATVYVIAPCYDGSSDHSYAHPYVETQRDEVTDAAKDLCALDQYGNYLHGLHFQNLDVTIRGRGQDARDNSTTLMAARGSGRMRGTTIAIDMGRLDVTHTPDVGIATTWFGRQAWTPISSGFTNSNVLNAQTGTSISDMIAHGTQGSGHVVNGGGDIDLRAMVDEAGGDFEICVCVDGAQCVAQRDNGTTPTGDQSTTADPWTDGLSVGDLMFITTTNALSSGSADQVTALRLLTIGDPVTDQCSDPPASGNDDGVPLTFGGNKVSFTDGANTTSIFTGLLGETLISGSNIIHISEDVFIGHLVIENLTIEPQDYWNEAGGDCNIDQGGALAEPKIYTISFDDDTDCDTAAMFKEAIGGKFTFRDVTMKNPGWFMLDELGGTEGGLFEYFTVVGTNGRLITDTQTRSIWRDLHVIDSWFIGPMFGGLTGHTIRNMVIERTVFTEIVTLDALSSRWDVDGILVKSSSFNTLFGVQGGAKYNRIKNIRSVGRLSGANASSPGATLLYFFLSSGDDPIEFNTFESFLDEPPMGTQNRAGRQTMIRFTINVEGEHTLIRSNSFIDFKQHSAVPNANAGIVCIGNGSDGSDFRDRVLELNTFMMLETDGDNVFRNSIGNDVCTGALAEGTVPRACESYAWPGGVRTLQGSCWGQYTQDIFIDGPTAADLVFAWRANSEWTISDIDCIVPDSTSVVITLRECDADGGSCSDVDGAMTCTTSNVAHSGNISNPVIDAGDRLRVLIGTVTGSTGVSVSITYDAE